MQCMRSAQICIRIDKRTILKLKSVCNDREEDVSDFVRRAIKKDLAKLGYLSKKEQKALGVI